MTVQSSCHVSISVKLFVKCARQTLSLYAFQFLKGLCQYDDIKVKFTLEQAMKAQRGSRGTDLFFLEPRR